MPGVVCFVLLATTTFAEPLVHTNSRTALAIVPFAPSATRKLPRINAKHLQEDLRHLAEGLSRAHPGLETYQSPHSFNAHVRGIERSLTEPLDAIDFSKVVMRMVALIHDGHTSVTLPGAVRGYLSKSNSRFPFTVRIVNRRIYTVCNQSDEAQIADGSELVAIDGMPAGQILEALKEHYSEDGFNETGLYNSLGLEHHPRPFGRVFPYVFGLPERFAVDYVRPGEREVRRCVVSAITPKTVGSRIWERYRGNVPGVSDDSRNHGFPPESPLVRHWIEGGVGVLRIARLVHGSYTEPDSVYAGFYADAFQDFVESEVDSVVIDLRDNGGGAGSNGALLMRHLISTPFVPTTEIWGKVDSLQELHAESKEYESGVKVDDTGRYVVQDREWLRDLKEYHPLEGKSFSGRIIVLINGGTRSAAAQLAGWLRHYTDAVFIGEETSGNAGMSNGVVLATVVGEHSGVGVRFPVTHSESSIPEGLRMRGVVTDLPFTPSIEHVIEGRDSLLDYALQVAAQSG